jgi:hypothetical protein
MLNALFRILPHPLDKRRIRNDIADVFVDERVPGAPTSINAAPRTTTTRTLAYPLPHAAHTPFSPS